jgi:hypothetical protein
MAIEFTIIDKLPEWAQTRGPSHSPCRDAFQQALACYPAWLRISSSDKREMERFHKAAIQFRARHRARFAAEIVKQGSTVFVRAQPKDEAGTDAAG